MKQTFTTVIKNTNPIVRDHRVHQVRIMPGVTFLDLIYRLLQREGFRVEDIMLKNVLFLEPVATSEAHDCKLELVLEQLSDTVQHITVRNQKIKHNTPLYPEWSTNLTCELHRSNGEVDGRIDISALKQSLRVMDIERVYEKIRSLQIHHYEFMKARGRVYIHENEMLAEIYLSDLAAKYNRDFLFHPAFFDCSTFFPFYFHNEIIDKPYIPIFIESFQAKGRLDAVCYVYVQRNSASSQSEDTMSNDYGIYDSSGNLMSRFTRFTSKQIRSGDLITKLTRLDHEQPDVASGPETTGRRETASATSANTETDRQVSIKEIASDLAQMIAMVAGMKPEKVRRDVGFYDQGLDSTQLISLVKQLETKVGEQLYPTLLFEYNTINDLARYLEETFARSYQLEAGSGTASPAVQNQEKRYPSEVLYYTGGWREAAINSEKSGVTAAFTSILLFDTDETICAYLRSKGMTCLLVKPGQGFVRRDAQVYEINPAERENYIQLMNELNAHHTLPEKVLYLWPYNNKRGYDLEGTLVEWESHVAKGIYAMLYLTQAFMLLKVHNRVQLLYLFRQTAAYTEAINAAISGFAKSLTLENPRFIYKSIELAASEDAVIERELVDQLLKEYHTQDRFQEVCYNKGRRYVKEMRQFFPENNTGMGEVLPLKQDGVYLITGGTGGLGMIFAEHLAKEVSPRIIVNGRSGLTAEIERKLERLRTRGASITYIQADITRREEVETLCTAICSRYGRIDGILHSAGIIRDAVIVQKQQDEMRRVLAPKIAGSIYLDMVTREMDLDFMVLFSSIAAVNGNFGQADYAYANSFMDRFAAQRNWLVKEGKRSGHTLSINWPLWADGGMQASQASMSEAVLKSGVVPLATGHGIDAFYQSLCTGHDQVLVVEGERAKIEAAFPAGIETRLERGAGSTVMTRTAIQPAAASAPNDRYEEDAIAIIGLSGKYPMARDLDEFWENLKHGKDCVSEIPQVRWNNDIYFDPDKNSLGTTYGKWGGFIDDVDKFDPLFFNISPREASMTDPQERLFLETVWQTLEDAGYTKASLRHDKVGVFVGVMWGQYQLLGLDQEGGMIAPSSVYASISNRVSYFFDFHGPSMAIDTMCSSSLTALELACNSIRNRESDLVVVGGVNLTLHPSKYVFLSMQGFLSTDGRCRSFGEGGDGYVPGEGVGAALLKPLGKAIADGDNIYGVIKGMAVNHGGRSAGYSVPNPKAQSEVIKEALANAKVNPATISYIEAHGTGTSLGDPIEIQGMTRAFQSYAAVRQFCAVGSVKSNIGHLEPAAGIASLSKVLLQMKHATLVPSIHAEVINPVIDFENTPFFVQRELSPWQRPRIMEHGEEVEYPRRAGISSFGAGGSNVHLIIEEHVHEKRGSSREEVELPQLIILSARKKSILLAYAEKMRVFVAAHLNMVQTREADAGEHLLANMAFTLQQGREQMEERLALLVHSLEELERGLSAFCQGDEELSCLYTGNSEKSSLRSMSVTDEPDSQEYLEAAIRTKAHDRLARLWCGGMECDWERVYDRKGRTRISLPTYPFEKKSYWITQISSGERYNTVTTAKEHSMAASAAKPSSLLAQGARSVQAIVADIYMEILQVEECDLDADFFDIGGNSIMGAKIVHKLEQTFHIAYKLSEFFEDPAVERVAASIEKVLAFAPEHASVLSRGDTAPVMISKRSGTGPSILSTTQKQFWFLQKVNPSSSEYTLPLALRIKGKLDQGMMRRSLELVMNNQESLRTAIIHKHDEPLQLIGLPEIDRVLEHDDFSTYPEDEKEKAVAAFLKKTTEHLFRLEGGPLIRLSIAKIDNEEHLLVANMHHLIGDAWSILFFVQQLLTVYRELADGKAGVVPERAIQFHDYIAWFEERLPLLLEQQLPYWKKQLAASPRELELPFDRPRPARVETTPREIPFSVTGDLKEKLLQVAKEYKVSLFVLLLAVFKIMLHKKSNQEDILVGAPVSHRNVPEIADLIGLLSNMLVLRSSISSRMRFSEVLDVVKKVTWDALDHQEIPFVKVFEALEIERGGNYNPLFQVVFNMIEMNELPETDAFSIAFLDAGPQAMNFDLLFRVYVTPTVLHGSLVYNGDIFDESTVREFLQEYHTVLAMVVDRHDFALTELEHAFPQNETPAEKREEERTPEKKLVVSSTFTDEPIEESLDFWLTRLGYDLTIDFAPYNQVYNQLLDPSQAMMTNRNGMNILLYRVEDSIRHEHSAATALLAQKAAERVEEFLKAVETGSTRVQVPLLIAICPSCHPANEEMNREYLQLEEMIEERLRQLPNVYCLRAGNPDPLYPVTEVFDHQANKAGHVPYTPEYFSYLGTKIARMLYAIVKKPYKVLVLDCDNTLWKGVCGEDGADGIELEAPYLAFQKFLVSQYEHGMLLCLNSKNNEEDVLQVFETRHDMVLKREHLVSWRINWQAKSENIRELASELRLGMDSFIFIDDNPTECAEVAAHCPAVLTMRFPGTAEGVARLTQHGWAFDHIKVTAEDRKRTEMYQQEIKRKESRNASLTFADYIKGLALRVDIHPIRQEEFERAEQLLLRTNQCNSTTKRRNMKELERLAHDQDWFVSTVHVGDRFGDYGLVGIMIGSCGSSLLVDSFVLSCRVMGKGVEHEMAAAAARLALEKKIPRIIFEYRASAKNAPVQQFFEHIAALPAKLETSLHYIMDAKEAANVKFDPQHVVQPEHGPGPAPSGPQAIVEERREREFLNQIIDAFTEIEAIHAHIHASFTQSSVKSVADGAFPGTEMEKLLASILQKELGLVTVSIDTNFFDMGATSLKLVGISSKLHEATGREIPIVAFFQHTTIRSLAEYLDNDTIPANLKKSIQRGKQQRRLATRIMQAREMNE